MKDKVLDELKRNSEEYISGEQLSNKLGVSRTAIWKYMSLLRSEGYDIESSTKKGYKLLSTLGVISIEKIKQELGTEFFGKQIVYYDTITSTNTVAKELASGGSDEGTLVVSEHQSVGKGRRGKEWISPPKTGIWMSLILRPDISPSQASFITLLSALAVAVSIEQIVKIKPGIKWPNDIVIDKKKICGILTEMSAEIDKINYVIVGIGINVNMEKEDFPDELHEIAASLKMITGQAVDRSILIRAILQNFEKYYKMAFKDGDRRGIIEMYKEYSLTLGSKVRASYSSEDITGIAVEITDEGELMIMSDKGDLHKILSGEVSVRGLYGYV